MTDENNTPPVLGAGETIETTRAFLPRFGADGLIPAIVTDATSGEVLMFAHMNEEALRKTLDTSVAHFWSRSRGKLWMKGEESGNRLRVREIRTDCDQDVIWLTVDIEGEGVACHTGARSCFYRRITIAPGASASASLENVAPPQRSRSG
jgi:phosphoribosyl-AMP cyclohydrolase